MALPATPVGFDASFSLARTSISDFSILIVIIIPLQLVRLQHLSR
jgi:hypothetical protein